MPPVYFKVTLRVSLQRALSHLIPKKAALILYFLAVKITQIKPPYSTLWPILFIFLLKEKIKILCKANKVSPSFPLNPTHSISSRSWYQAPPGTKPGRVGGKKY